MDFDLKNRQFTKWLLQSGRPRRQYLLRKLNLDLMSRGIPVNKLKNGLRQLAQNTEVCIDRLSEKEIEMHTKREFVRDKCTECKGPEKSEKNKGSGYQSTLFLPSRSDVSCHKRSSDVFPDYHDVIEKSIGRAKFKKFKEGTEIKILCKNDKPVLSESEKVCGSKLTNNPLQCSLHNVNDRIKYSDNDKLLRDPKLNIKFQSVKEVTAHNCAKAIKDRVLPPMAASVIESTSNNICKNVESLMNTYESRQNGVETEITEQDLPHERHVYSVSPNDHISGKFQDADGKKFKILLEPRVIALSDAEKKQENLTVLSDGTNENASTQKMLVTIRRNSDGNPEKNTKSIEKVSFEDINNKYESSKNEMKPGDSQHEHLINENTLKVQKFVEDVSFEKVREFESIGQRPIIFVTAEQEITNSTGELKKTNGTEELEKSVSTGEIERTVGSATLTFSKVKKGPEGGVLPSTSNTVNLKVKSVTNKISALKFDRTDHLSLSQNINTMTKTIVGKSNRTIGKEHTISVFELNNYTDTMKSSVASQLSSVQIEPIPKETNISSDTQMSVDKESKQTELTLLTENESVNYKVNSKSHKDEEKGSLLKRPNESEEAEIHGLQIDQKTASEYCEPSKKKLKLTRSFIELFGHDCDNIDIFKANAKISKSLEVELFGHDSDDTEPLKINNKVSETVTNIQKKKNESELKPDILKQNGNAARETNKKIQPFARNCSFTKKLCASKCLISHPSKIQQDVLIAKPALKQCVEQQLINKVPKRITSGKVKSDDVRTKTAKEKVLASWMSNATNPPACSKGRVPKRSKEIKSANIPSANKKSVVKNPHAVSKINYLRQNSVQSYKPSLAKVGEQKRKSCPPVIRRDSLVTDNFGHVDILNVAETKKSSTLECTLLPNETRLKMQETEISKSEQTNNTRKLPKGLESNRKDFLPDIFTNSNVAKKHDSGSDLVHSLPEDDIIQEDLKNAKYSQRKELENSLENTELSNINFKTEIDDLEHNPSAVSYSVMNDNKQSRAICSMFSNEKEKEIEGFGTDDLQYKEFTRPLDETKVNLKVECGEEFHSPSSISSTVERLDSGTGKVFIFTTEVVKQEENVMCSSSNLLLNEKETTPAVVGSQLCGNEQNLDSQMKVELQTTEKEPERNAEIPKTMETKTDTEENMPVAQKPAYELNESSGKDLINEEECSEMRLVELDGQDNIPMASTNKGTLQDSGNVNSVLKDTETKATDKTSDHDNNSVGVADMQDNSDNHSEQCQTSPITENISHSISSKIKVGSIRVKNPKDLGIKPSDSEIKELESYVNTFPNQIKNEVIDLTSLIVSSLKDIERYKNRLNEASKLTDTSRDIEYECARTDFVHSADYKCEIVFKKTRFLKIFFADKLVNILHYFVNKRIECSLEQIDEVYTMLDKQQRQQQSVKNSQSARKTSSKETESTDNSITNVIQNNRPLHQNGHNISETMTHIYPHSTVIRKTGSESTTVQVTPGNVASQVNSGSVMSQVNPANETTKYLKLGSASTEQISTGTVLPDQNVSVMALLTHVVPRTTLPSQVDPGTVMPNQQGSMIASAISQGNVPVGHTDQSSLPTVQECQKTLPMIMTCQTSAPTCQLVQENTTSHEHPATVANQTAPVRVSMCQAPPTRQSSTQTALVSVSTTQATPVRVSTSQAAPARCLTRQADKFTINVLQTSPQAYVVSKVATEKVMSSNTPLAKVASSQGPPASIASSQVPTGSLRMSQVCRATMSSHQVPPEKESSSQVPPATMSSQVLPVAVSSSQVPSEAVSSSQVLPVTVSSSQVLPVTVSSSEGTTVAVSSSQLHLAAIVSSQEPPASVVSSQLPPVSVSSSKTSPMIVVSSQASPVTVATSQIACAGLVTYQVPPASLVMTQAPSRKVLTSQSFPVMAATSEVPPVSVVTGVTPCISAATTPISGMMVVMPTSSSVVDQTLPISAVTSETPSVSSIRSPVSSMLVIADKLQVKYPNVLVSVAQSKSVPTKQLLDAHSVPAGWSQHGSRLSIPTSHIPYSTDPLQTSQADNAVAMKMSRVQNRDPIHSNHVQHKTVLPTQVHHGAVLPSQIQHGAVLQSQVQHGTMLASQVKLGSNVPNQAQCGNLMPTQIQRGTSKQMSQVQCGTGMHMSKLQSGITVQARQDESRNTMPSIQVQSGRVEQTSQTQNECLVLENFEHTVTKHPKQGHSRSMAPSDSEVISGPGQVPSNQLMINNINPNKKQIVSVRPQQTQMAYAASSQTHTASTQLGNNHVYMQQNQIQNPYALQNYNVSEYAPSSSIQFTNVPVYQTESGSLEQSQTLHNSSFSRMIPNRIQCHSSQSSQMNRELLPPNQIYYGQQLINHSQANFSMQPGNVGANFTQPAVVSSHNPQAVVEISDHRQSGFLQPLPTQGAAPAFYGTHPSSSNYQHSVTPENPRYGALQLNYFGGHPRMPDPNKVTPHLQQKDNWQYKHRRSAEVQVSSMETTGNTNFINQHNKGFHSSVQKIRPRPICVEMSNQNKLCAYPVTAPFSKPPPYPTNQRNNVHSTVEAHRLNTNTRMQSHVESTPGTNVRNLHHYLAQSSGYLSNGVVGVLPEAVILGTNFPQSGCINSSASSLATSQNNMLNYSQFISANMASQNHLIPKTDELNCRQSDDANSCPKRGRPNLNSVRNNSMKQQKICNKNNLYNNTNTFDTRVSASKAVELQPPRHAVPASSVKSSVASVSRPTVRNLLKNHCITKVRKNQGRSEKNKDQDLSEENACKNHTLTNTPQSTNNLAKLLTDTGHSVVGNSQTVQQNCSRIQTNVQKVNDKRSLTPKATPPHNGVLSPITNVSPCASTCVDKYSSVKADNSKAAQSNVSTLAKNVRHSSHIITTKSQCVSNPLGLSPSVSNQNSEEYVREAGILPSSDRQSALISGNSMCITPQLAHKNSDNEPTTVTSEVNNSDSADRRQQNFSKSNDSNEIVDSEINKISKNNNKVENGITLPNNSSQITNSNNAVELEVKTVNVKEKLAVISKSVNVDYNSDDIYILEVDKSGSGSISNMAEVADSPDNSNGGQKSNDSYKVPTPSIHNINENKAGSHEISSTRHKTYIHEVNNSDIKTRQVLSVEAAAFGEAAKLETNSNTEDLDIKEFIVSDLARDSELSLKLMKNVDIFNKSKSEKIAPVKNMEQELRRAVVDLETPEGNLELEMKRCEENLMVAVKNVDQELKDVVDLETTECSFNVGMKNRCKKSLKSSTKNVNNSSSEIVNSVGNNKKQIPAESVPTNTMDQEGGTVIADENEDVNFRLEGKDNCEKNPSSPTNSVISSDSDVEIISCSIEENEVQFVGDYSPVQFVGFIRNPDSKTESSRIKEHSHKKAKSAFGTRKTFRENETVELASETPSNTDIEGPQNSEPRTVSRDSGYTTPSDTLQSGIQEVIIDKEVFCAACENAAQIVCTGCYITCYCSLDCQGSHWIEVHHDECKPNTGIKKI